MAASLNKLQDRSAAVAALLEDLSKVEDRTEAQAADVAKLTAEAAELEDRLATEAAIAEKVASLRSKVAATAKPVAVESPEAPAPRKAARHDRYKRWRWLPTSTTVPSTEMFRIPSASATETLWAVCRLP